MLDTRTIFLELKEIQTEGRSLTAFFLTEGCPTQLQVVNNDFAFGEILFPSNPKDGAIFSGFLIVNYHNSTKLPIFSAVIAYQFIESSNQWMALPIDQIQQSKEIYFISYVNTPERLSMTFTSI